MVIEVEMEQVIMEVEVAELRQEDGQSDGKGGDDGNDGTWDRDDCVFPGGDDGDGIWDRDDCVFPSGDRDIWQ